MRIGKVLKLRVCDVEERRIHMISPKSGKPSEVVFIPQKVTDPLKAYIAMKGLETDLKAMPVEMTLQMINFSNTSGNVSVPAPGTDGPEAAVRINFPGF